MRVILVNLLFFLLPFIGYGLFLFFTRDRIDASDVLRGKPFFWLVGSGMACVVIGLVVLATYQTGTPEAVYVPTRYENGELVPGGFRNPDELTDADREALSGFDRGAVQQ